MKLARLARLAFPFGGGTAPAPGPAAEDLLSGILALYATTDLPAEMPLYSVVAGDGAARPYAVASEATAQEEIRTDTLVGYSITVKFAVYAADLDAAGRLGDRLVRALAGRRPAFAGAAVGPLIVPRDPIHRHDPGRARGGEEAYWQDREMRVRVVRSL